MNTFAILSFLFFTGLVAVVSWYKTRKENLTTSEGYFLGGRSLGFFMIGGSLFLTNMSANNFIGENESVYLTNMAVMAWGMSSIFAMLIVSEFFMPIYLRSGMITTPDFLEERFDSSVKYWVSILFVLGYAINLMPPVLYAGALAFNGMFGISDMLSLDSWTTLWILVFAIGIVGSIYAIFGGLKAIAVSDAMTGIGMVVGGLMVPYFALKFLGDGSMIEGWNIITSSKTEHLNAIGGPTDPVPFSTLFTGMLLVNLHYWGTEQYIMQRALAAKNLAEGQKGIILAGFGKVISPLLLNIPGLVAVHLYLNMENTAEVYPRLVGDVLPPYLTGFFAAVIFGAALTTFNSGLNSASTLFVLNIYKPLREKKQKVVSDLELIATGKKLQLVLAIMAMFIAPFIALVEGGFFNYIQQVASLFSVPIFTVLFIGFVTKRVPTIAAKVGLAFFVIIYGLTQTVLPTGLHFLHVSAILFVITSSGMLLYGKLHPREMPYIQEDKKVVSLQPWKYRHAFSAILILIVIGVYVIFSPLGLAK